MHNSSSQHSKILTSLSSSLTLPDDRPITAIQIVEYVEKCPRGFLAISKTHDADQDADLWREQSFFSRSKSGRYLCLSKSEGLPDFVVQDIVIVNEKSIPPEGYSLLHRTADTEQKAWRKRQLCYRLVNTRVGRISQAVTDIIVCNRIKKAPDGFALAGEINGMTICYKMGNVQDTQNSNSVFHQELPSATGSPPEVPRRTKAPTPPSTDTASGDHDYEILLPNYTPVRPAPGPPTPVQVQNPPHCGTLHAHIGLEGVPFVLSPRLSNNAQGQSGTSIPHIKQRTMAQLDRDYNYDFHVERHT